MRTFSTLARELDGYVPRSWLALVANSMLLLRPRDRRRFAVDVAGRWVNCQPGMTIVSPDLHTAHHDQLRSATLDTWCQAYMPKTGDTVIDVGAGIGEEAIFFSKLVGKTGRVICVEAHPGTFNCLEATVHRSRLENVLPIHCAITDHDGLSRISDFDEHLANRLVTGGGGTVIPSRTIESLVKELGITSIDFLKMNIEGAERTAVDGMRGIARTIRHCAISCHDFIADAGGAASFRTKRHVSSVLLDEGFVLSTHDRPDRPWLRDVIYAQHRAERPT